MNTQLIFAKSLKVPDSFEQKEFMVTLQTEGVKITVDDKLWIIAWEYVEDVEHLANVFQLVPVWEFRVMVEMLAQAIKARALAEELA